MQRMQIPLEIAADVLNASWASSAMLSRLLDRRLAASAEPSHATIGGLRAPQQLIRDLLATHGLTAPVSTAALDAFAAACRRGKGGNDLTELGDPAPC
jgi:3-hydroxyisobutyrate dehydrogenase-like beta-hydroxyacid dehydrogenase